MSEQVVNFHFGPKADTKKHDAVLGRSHGGIFSGIKDFGMLPTVTRGVDSIDFSAGVIRDIWVPQVVEGKLETVKDTSGLNFDEVGVIRDYGRLIDPQSDHPVRLLNERSVMRFDTSKIAAFNEILSGVQASMVSAAMGETAILDVLNGQRFVMKPDNGYGGEGVKIVTRGELALRLGEQPSVESFVVQEYVNMLEPFPSYIVGMNDEDQSKIDRLSDIEKELRIIMFFGRNGAKMIPIARFNMPDENRSAIWANVDSDKIPDDVYSLAFDAFSRMNKNTGVDQIYGCVDLSWSTIERDYDTKWRVNEMNLWRPVFFRGGDAGVRDEYDRSMAELLVERASIGDKI